MKYLKGLAAAGVFAGLVAMHASPREPRPRAALRGSVDVGAARVSAKPWRAAASTGSAEGYALAMRSHLPLQYPRWQNVYGLDVVPRALAVHIGDFDRDAIEDLAAVVGPFDDDGSLRLVRWRGGAGGAFGALAEIVLHGAGTPTAHASVDIDQDGHRELVLARMTDLTELTDRSSLQVLHLRGGALRIDTLELDPAHGRLQALTPADVDRDGDLDVLALAVRRGSNGRDYRVSLLQARNTAGTLAVDTVRPLADWIGNYPPWSSLAAGDFDADGRVDVAVYWAAETTSSHAEQTEPDLGALQILRGDGAGGFAAPRTLATESEGALAASLVVGDFDGDGRDDLAGVAPRDRRLHVAVFAQGPGGLPATPRLQPSTQLIDAPTARGHELVAADMDGDLRMDIVMRVWSPIDLIGLHRQAAGTLGYADVHARDHPATPGARLGHLDDDACPDLVMATADGLDIFGSTRCPGDRPPPLSTPLPPQWD